MTETITARWRKSSYSGNEGNCVEVADNLPSVVGVRDSKDIAGPSLAFTAAQWGSFVEFVKDRTRG
ncbi:DUF397 domain-containing protein [Micromonospora sp. WMMD998]|uniref:DUF397 domain-containing protein n=1 Tax=Micromonospora sp. WMMD998 TaxID=3016092 RepID=UPI00249B3BA8|nr:DUF397 domain-containing protein [Micromonospora sp. WMMD998]WFE41985.1 DUF397 domain-containing protein [Micromonospora sp. WMMD998]